MLSRAALSVVHVLADQQTATIDEISTETGYSKKQIYRTVDTLVSIGELRESRGTKNRRKLQADDGRLTTAYRRLLTQASHVNWLDLISPALLRVCWYLDEPRRIERIADRLDKTYQAVRAALDPLTDRALLSPAGPEYALASNVSRLNAVADAFARQSHRTRLLDHAETATIDWYDAASVVVHPRTSAETAALQTASEWHETGIDALANYGLEFHSPGEPRFWHSPAGSPSPEHVACHTILADPEPRRVSYAMLLLEHTDSDYEYLHEIAQWYGIEEIVSSIIDATDDEAEWPTVASLPSQQEYDSLKAQYEV